MLKVKKGTRQLPEERKMREDSSGYVRLSEKLRESISQSDSDSIGCEHLGQVKDVKHSAGGCEDCL